ncbi:MAG: hypothetical protein D6736_06465, partial [Nitrospinota bacterium]
MSQKSPIWPEQWVNALRIIARPVIATLQRMRVHPNLVSLVGFLVAILAFLFGASGRFLGFG